MSVTKLNGVTHNPWRHGRTVGGSSAVRLQRWPEGWSAWPPAATAEGRSASRPATPDCWGMKGTFGRIPRSPHAYTRPNTVVLGNVSRSVRDAARYYDVCAGHHPYDPSSLPSVGGWESGLGSYDLEGRRVAVVPALGGVTLEAGVEDRIRDAAAMLIADTGMVQVDLDVDPAEHDRPVDDGQPGHAPGRPGRSLAGLRARPHRRDRPRSTPGPVAVQPADRGGGRGAADPGQRDDGGRVRRGRPHHRGDESGACVRGRGLDEQQRGRTSSTGPRRARSAARACRPRCSGCGWRPRCGPICPRRSCARCRPGSPIW